ncbi:flagellar basal body rod protein FlgC [Texcoconibacillus texcoconensis]|uniref:Flagellar basal-body rod protein FlgC n=1 Tax=Texcoconibacillus texcoconensis TaxID=1095777 RepID=A0A840QL38_9BACI|nr:flagellar basal body rod protein FlgC [Texcoconibacillus texcoconensis]MBB5172082.1 flagellar basal-body rod protein FlgC [Texcoconibacillus texcoconensis]
MSIFSGLNTSASGLTSQRARMDVASSNIANANSTRAEFVDGEWQPYRRKMTVLEPNQQSSFSSHLGRAMQTTDSTGQGVKVGQIVDDPTPFKQVYQPEHPDANEDGYVAMPNVDPLKEMVDLMSASRSYEASVTAVDAHKNILMKALEIGR